MATRQETAQRRAQLAHDLREGCRAGQWAPGEMVPTLTALVKRYQVSAPVVHEEIRKLVDEGVLYAVPRVGTFVNASPAPAEPFLVLLHDTTPLTTRTLFTGHESRARRGFEERIAELGGAVIALWESEANRHFERGELPPLAGVFESTDNQLTPWLQQIGVPTARFGRLIKSQPNSDAVRFDDVEGGRRATEHLLKLGHRHIAFVGLHGDTPDAIFFWSQEREDGWRAAMREAGYATAELSFHPDAPPTIEQPNQIRAAREVAATLATRREITAIVAANMFAARGIVEVLQDADLPDEDWPALVSFDELEDRVTSALALPWEEIGRQGAELLWQRATGQYRGVGRQQLVPMKLIPRLTCRPQWAQTTRMLQGHSAATPPGIAVGVAA